MFIVTNHRIIPKVRQNIKITSTWIVKKKINTEFKVLKSRKKLIEFNVNYSIYQLVNYLIARLCFFKFNRILFINTCWHNNLFCKILRFISVINKLHLKTIIFINNKIYCFTLLNFNLKNSFWFKGAKNHSFINFFKIKRFNLNLERYYEKYWQF